MAVRRFDLFSCNSHRMVTYNAVETIVWLRKPFLELPKLNCRGKKVIRTLRTMAVIAIVAVLIDPSFSVTNAENVIRNDATATYVAERDEPFEMLSARLHVMHDVVYDDGTVTVWVGRKEPHELMFRGAPSTVRAVLPEKDSFHDEFTDGTSIVLMFHRNSVQDVAAIGSAIEAARQIGPRARIVIVPYTDERRLRNWSRGGIPRNSNATPIWLILHGSKIVHSDRGVMKPQQICEWSQPFLPAYAEDAPGTSSM